MTTHQLACPACGRVLSIPASAIGKRVRCSGCSTRSSILEADGRVILRARAAFEELTEDDSGKSVAARSQPPARVRRPARQRRGAAVRPGLVLVAGIVQLLGSLQWLGSGAVIVIVGASLGSSGSVGAEFGILFVALGSVLLSLGCVLLWAGFGLLNGSPAARMTSLVISGLGLLLGVGGMIPLVRSTELTVGPLVLIQPMIALAWPLLMIFCLVNAESVKWFEAHGRSGRPRRTTRRRVAPGDA